jgi:hypothetical protein
MKRLFKVICGATTYGTFSTIEKARKLRDLLKREGKNEIIITVTEEDIDPR